MRIVLVGFGVVGQGVARLLLERRETLARRHGIRPVVVGIADRSGLVTAPRGIDLAAALEAKARSGGASARVGTLGRGPTSEREQTPRDSSPSSAGTESRIGLEPAGPRPYDSIDSDVLIEVTSSNLADGEPALSTIRAALSSHRHVITANKGPLAHALPALLELARHHGVALRFSGSVGGGTPVLDFAGKCLPGNRVLALRGILNGTSNYILSRMTDAALPFSAALGEAQSAGYAETDPTADVDGLDAAAKLSILANWAMERRVTIRDVAIEGIRGVTMEEMAAARREGAAIKLIAGADAEGLRVRPERVPLTDPLCVHGALNAVTFVTEDAGAQTLVGKGAGGRETASAIVRDLVEVKQRYRVEG
ncbi:MAG: homoserine dehydrogenase [Planctomycetes bacterium]|nr:homoserine dehydrogenase [Planctomycetota bacterium]